MTDFLARLRDLPATAMMPVGWIVQQLETEQQQAPATPAVFDCAGLAKRWRRSASYVRALFETGELPGSKAGRRWSTSAEAVQAYEKALGEQGKTQAKAGPVERKPVSLSAWRQQREGGR